jgi:hypothetical protein
MRREGLNGAPMSFFGNIAGGRREAGGWEAGGWRLRIG